MPVVVGTQDLARAHGIDVKLVTRDPALAARQTARELGMDDRIMAAELLANPAMGQVCVVPCDVM